jgi:branched-chain amino acid transport system permease protein
VINGWVLFFGALIWAFGLRSYANAREAKPVESEVPVEWWGLRRAWRAEDEEVLDRGVATG